MIRYLYADQLARFPRLRDTMFRDRAHQFKERLGWEVTVDEDGFERDEYDDLGPLYVIYELPDGTHGGSMRLLPTTGQTMINDHFLHLTDGVRIQSPFLWESTRFCLSQDAGPEVSACLMLASAELIRQGFVEQYVAVFDARMIRIYKMLGAAPTVLGTSGEGRDAISVGIWELTDAVYDRLLARARVTCGESTRWFDQSFGFRNTGIELKQAV